MRIFKWGSIPVIATFTGIGYYSLARDATTWGFPAWVWLAVANALFFVVGIFIIVGFWRENNRLRKVGMTTTTTGNTVVVTQNYEQIKKSVIADIQAGKIKVKGMINARIENVSKADKAFLRLLAWEMKFRHGHTDASGLLADRASGIDLNELIKRDCTICGKPRSQRKGESN